MQPNTQKKRLPKSFLGIKYYQSIEKENAMSNISYRINGTSIDWHPIASNRITITSESPMFNLVKWMLTNSDGVMLSVPLIKKVIFNDPATIVLWSDNTKTVVKCENEEYDKEKGLAMAIAKKALGNKGNYYNAIKKWTEQ